MPHIGSPTLPQRRRAAGFSLIELAIVVLITSIVLTMGLAAFNAQIDSFSFSDTQKRQDIIKEALIAYLRANRRLPCPETTGLAGSGTAPAGRESRTNGLPPDPGFACASYVGTLPWLDLGLNKDIALDGYGNFFTYYVASAAQPADPDWARTPGAGGATGFNVGNPGRFAITHNGQQTGIDTYSYPLPALAAVVLVSHGKNGLGAITEKGTRNAAPTDAAEIANAPPVAALSAPDWSPQTLPYASLGMLAPAVTRTLVTGSTTAGGSFDDIVLALRPNDLLGPLIKDGAVKSAESLVQEQLATARDMAISAMLANDCTPQSSPSLPVDSWGTRIQYGNPSSTKMTASDLAGTAFRLWSNGRNRTNDSTSGTLGGDDIALPTGIDVTYGQILSRIPTLTSACP